MKRSAALLLATVCSVARVAVAQPYDDGVYGRLDGSLDLGVGAGVELEHDEPRALLRADAHYLSTAGAYLRYADGFGSNERRPQRALAFGIDVRPLFLPRFALDLQHGPALLDLTLDSLSLSAGAFFARPDHSDFGDARGFDLGLGFGVPLWAKAGGPWLDWRAERRFADHGRSAWLFSLALSYHFLTLRTEPSR